MTNTTTAQLTYREWVLAREKGLVPAANGTSELVETNAATQASILDMA